ncbi:MAG: dihydrodipicolinate synthase family protein, partial [Chloroflexia bacterium]|nr:dihydrodipicolinate synthase family protein [Chloroflexia bacterium]
TGTWPGVERARRAAALGADAVMVLPPYFVKPDGDNLVDYYQQMAEAAGVPLMIQDAPQLTGVAMAPALWARMAEQIPLLRYIKVEGSLQGPLISETRRLAGDQVSLFCGWGGLGMIDALERGAVGSMPAPNFTRHFAEIQMRYEAGDAAGAGERFREELPFVLWAMQSIDHSVTSAKEELRRRGVIASAHLRQPAMRLDEIAWGQLRRFLDRRLGGAVAPE